MMNFSDLLHEKKIKIVNGVAEMVYPEINGEITFKSFNLKLAKKIQSEVIVKMTGKETEEEITYKILPYLVDINMDISFEQFIDAMTSENEVVLLIYDGVIDILNKIISNKEKVEKTNKKLNNINNKLGEIALDEKEILNKLLQDKYVEFEKTTDTKEKDKIIKEIIEIKNKLESL